LIDRYSKEMARPVKPPQKRAYDSSRRRAQARETQHHIAQTARSLFLERGYTATSIRDIADEAGVAVQTIYNAFDGKPAILSRILDVAVVGDDAPVALADRDVMRQMLEETEPRLLIDMWSSFATAIFVRFLPMLPVVREAAAIEPAIAALWRTNAYDNRLAGIRSIAARLDELGALPPDIDAGTAADVMWTYVSFETAEALLRERGWTADQVTSWSARLIKAAFDIH
jgi:TetR/AcrR family transcriptional regulator, regulator of autoinduction and epiphytic fitness